MMVVARLMPMPNAVPPRCVLVARGAPKKTMITHATGIAILSESSTLISLSSAPDRSSDRMKRLSSRKPICSGLFGADVRSIGASSRSASRTLSKAIATLRVESESMCRSPDLSVHALCVVS
jgi:hypothetical protein